ncbi:hypothetical protein SARC_00496 [Sphaeroforma arctica JP610]|uniref:SANT domain-containing protein n=1 Tax=Sphaeroforma arctica JP610 TaxID=667725 RepID=A0A0L0GEW1_9EUKA|nr:hypothetical protein SARC_00496 [Sphaeroforma arctica JP610]KNC87406.1 hypothetical protein SARC_00496 [Sphaeroforma arctica JP610]|eukprot:XP_014161308.1 hypothetical protein SARC_00496 [Sphaeroforma arctica JP610]
MLGESLPSSPASPGRELEQAAHRSTQQTSSSPMYDAPASVSVSVPAQILRVVMKSPRKSQAAQVSHVTASVHVDDTGSTGGSSIPHESTSARTRASSDAIAAVQGDTLNVGCEEHTGSTQHEGSTYTIVVSQDSVKAVADGEMSDSDVSRSHEEPASRRSDRKKRARRKVAVTNATPSIKSQSQSQSQAESATSVCGADQTEDEGRDKSTGADDKQRVQANANGLTMNDVNEPLPAQPEPNVVATTASIADSHTSVSNCKRVPGAKDVCTAACKAVCANACKGSSTCKKGGERRTKSSWTVDENKLFFESFLKVGKEFDKIRVAGRMQDQIRNYYYQNLKMIYKMLGDECKPASGSDERYQLKCLYYLQKTLNLPADNLSSSFSYTHLFAPRLKQLCLEGKTEFTKMGKTRKLSCKRDKYFDANGIPLPKYGPCPHAHQHPHHNHHHTDMKPPPPKKYPRLKVSKTLKGTSSKSSVPVRAGASNKAPPSSKNNLSTTDGLVAKTVSESKTTNNSSRSRTSAADKPIGTSTDPGNNPSLKTGSVGPVHSGAPILEPEAETVVELESYKPQVSTVDLDNDTNDGMCIDLDELEECLSDVDDVESEADSRTGKGAGASCANGSLKTAEGFTRDESVGTSNVGAPRKQNESVPMPQRLFMALGTKRQGKERVLDNRRRASRGSLTNIKKATTPSDAPALATDTSTEKGLSGQPSAEGTPAVLGSKTKINGDSGLWRSKSASGAKTAEKKNKKEKSKTVLVNKPPKPLQSKLSTGSQPGPTIYDQQAALSARQSDSRQHATPSPLHTQSNSSPAHSAQPNEPPSANLALQGPPPSSQPHPTSALSSQSNPNSSPSVPNICHSHPGSPTRTQSRMSVPPQTQLHSCLTTRSQSQSNSTYSTHTPPIQQPQLTVQGTAGISESTNVSSQPISTPHSLTPSNLEEQNLKQQPEINSVLSNQLAATGEDDIVADTAPELPVTAATKHEGTSTHMNAKSPTIGLSVAAESTTITAPLNYTDDTNMEVDVKISRRVDTGLEERDLPLTVLSSASALPERKQTPIQTINDMQRSTEKPKPTPTFLRMSTDMGRRAQSGEEVGLGTHIQGETRLTADNPMLSHTDFGSGGDESDEELKHEISQLLGRYSKRKLQRYLSKYDIDTGSAFPRANKLRKHSHANENTTASSPGEQPTSQYNISVHASKEVQPSDVPRNDGGIGKGIKKKPRRAVLQTISRPLSVDLSKVNLDPASTAMVRDKTSSVELSQPIGVKRKSEEEGTVHSKAPAGSSSGLSGTNIFDKNAEKFSDGYSGLRSGYSSLSLGTIKGHLETTPAEEIRAHFERSSHGGIDFGSNIFGSSFGQNNEMIVSSEDRFGAAYRTITGETPGEKLDSNGATPNGINDIQTIPTHEEMNGKSSINIDVDVEMDTELRLVGMSNDATDMHLPAHTVPASQIQPKPQQLSQSTAQADIQSSFLHQSHQDIGSFVRKDRHSVSSTGSGGLGNGMYDFRAGTPNTVIGAEDHIRAQHRMLTTQIVHGVTCDSRTSIGDTHLNPASAMDRQVLGADQLSWGDLDRDVELRLATIRAQSDTHSDIYAQASAEIRPQSGIHAQANSSMPVQSDARVHATVDVSGQYSERTSRYLSAHANGNANTHPLEVLQIDANSDLQLSARTLTRAQSSPAGKASMNTERRQPNSTPTEGTNSTAKTTSGPMRVDMVPALTDDKERLLQMGMNPLITLQIKKGSKQVSKILGHLEKKWFSRSSVPAPDITLWATPLNQTTATNVMRVKFSLRSCPSAATVHDLQEILGPTTAENIRIQYTLSNTPPPSTIVIPFQKPFRLPSTKQTQVQVSTSASTHNTTGQLSRPHSFTNTQTVYSRHSPEAASLPSYTTPARQLENTAEQQQARQSQQMYENQQQARQRAQPQSQSQKQPRSRQNGSNLPDFRQASDSLSLSFSSEALGEVQTVPPKDGSVMSATGPHANGHTGVELSIDHNAVAVGKDTTRSNQPVSMGRLDFGLTLQTDHVQAQHENAVWNGAAEHDINIHLNDKQGTGQGTGLANMHGLLPRNRTNRAPGVISSSFGGLHNGLDQDLPLDLQFSLASPRFSDEVRGRDNQNGSKKLDQTDFQKLDQTQPHVHAPVEVQPLSNTPKAAARSPSQTDQSFFEDHIMPPPPQTVRSIGKSSEFSFEKRSSDDIGPPQLLSEHSLASKPFETTINEARVSKQLKDTSGQAPLAEVEKRLEKPTFVMTCTDADNQWSGIDKVEIPFSRKESVNSQVSKGPGVLLAPSNSPWGDETMDVSCDGFGTNFFHPSCLEGGGSSRHAPHSQPPPFGSNASRQDIFGLNENSLSSRVRMDLNGRKISKGDMSGTSGHAPLGSIFHGDKSNGLFWGSYQGHVDGHGGSKNGSTSAANTQSAARKFDFSGNNSEAIKFVQPNGNGRSWKPAKNPSSEQNY